MSFRRSRYLHAATLLQLWYRQRDKQNAIAKRETWTEDDGELHVIMEDGNVELGLIVEWQAKTKSQAAKDICAALAEMTQSDRERLFVHGFEYYIKGDSILCFGGESCRCGNFSEEEDEL